MHEYLITLADEAGAEYSEVVSAADDGGALTEVGGLAAAWAEDKPARITWCITTRDDRLVGEGVLYPNGLVGETVGPHYGPLRDRLAARP